MKERLRNIQRIAMLIVAVFFLNGSGDTARVIAQQMSPLGNHQAAAENYQDVQLSKLQTQEERSGLAPRGISPEYWNFLLVPGNEPTAERIALGRKLYFEPKLSMDGTVSCATCHDVTRGFADALPTSEGIDKVTSQGKVKQFGTRNAPTTMNITLLHTMFWDGRSPSVEHQAMQPIINPVEMGMPNAEETIIAGIKGDPEYQRMFQAAYGRAVNYKDIGNALAVFERTLNFVDSSFFRYLQGDDDAISEDAKEGWVLFNREGRCTACHQMSPSNPLGTDNKFHNIGVAAKHQNFGALAREAEHLLAEDASEEKIDKLALTTEVGELGRFLITRKLSDIGAFRTPMLLNVGITGPYMHDGSFKTLWDVVDHYNSGGEANLYLDGGIEPLNLSDREVDQIVAFLFSLTDVRFSAQNADEFSRQKKIAEEGRPERKPDVVSRKVLSFEKYDAVQQMKGAAK